MSNTTSKLNEAKFFLNKLQEETKMPDFNYYLSACISSSRSILWMMRSEYTHVEGWNEWYDGQNISKEEKELFKKINAIRVRTVKTSTLHTATKAIFDVTKESVTDEVKKKMKAFDKKKVSITISEKNDNDINNQDENTVTINGKFNTYYQTLKDFPEEDVIKICETYINSLEKWVLECERLFGDKIEMELVEGWKIKFSDPDIFK